MAIIPKKLPIYGHHDMIMAWGSCFSNLGCPWYSSVGKKGTFICELILERYIYMRNTKKQLKITNYVRNKSFFEFLDVPKLQNANL